VLRLLDTKTIKVIKSTVPVLEEHGEKITTVFYKQMFEAHPELLHIFNHANQQQGKQQRALASTVYAAAQYIDNLEAILPAVRQIAHKHRSLGIKPEHYPIVGTHLLAAIKDVLGDAATDEILEAWGEAYQVIAGIFISVEAEMYDEAENQQGGWEDFKSFTVERKVKESDTITSFYLRPEDGKGLPNFRPGQYISVKLEIPGQEYTHIRQYSLSDAPGKDFYRISVKRETHRETPDGTVSNFLHDSAEEGSSLLISAPAGDFVVNTETKTPLVLLSGGVGLTPMVSMLKTVAELQPERQVTFIHATSNSRLHALREDVSAAAAQGNVKTVYFYDNPTPKDREQSSFDVKGYVTKDWINENIEIQDADFFFCGPVPFMKHVNSALKELEVPAERIHYEFFGPKGDLSE
jgi:nitric oxide dioxygenase